MDCFHQDAIGMEAGFLILLVTYVVHLQQVITLISSYVHIKFLQVMHITLNYPCTAANCGDPPPPSDGYLEPYTSTSEGARVNRVYICQNGQVETEEIVCNSDGQWEVSRSNACTIKPSIIIIKIFIPIYYYYNIIRRHLCQLPSCVTKALIQSGLRHDNVSVLYNTHLPCHHVF